MNPYESSEVFYRLGEFSSVLEGIDLFFYGNGRLSSNIYVLDEGEVLVDTGNYSYLLMDYFSFYPRSEIKKVIITHAHTDHIGGLFIILSRFRPEIYIHELELEGVVREKTLKGILTEMGFGDLVRPLKGNEEIELSSRKLRVLYTPGHTPGSICLYDPEKGVLFSSDTLFPMGDDWALLPAADPQGGSLEDLAQSVRFFLKLELNAFLPGHLFPVFKNPKDHVKKTYFELQLQIQKREDLAYINTGIAIADSGDLDEAIRFFDRVLEKEPLHPGACFVKALALFQKGKLEEAKDYLEKALSVYPDFKEALKLKEEIEKIIQGRKSK